MFQLSQFLSPSISSRWLETGQVLLFNRMDWDNVEVHNNTKEARSQYLTILTEQVWSILWTKQNLYFQDKADKCKWTR